MRGLCFGACAVFFAFSTLAADLTTARWTAKDRVQGELAASLAQVNAATGQSFTADDLTPYEDRELATSHFKMWVQQVQGLPVFGTALRIWVDKKTGVALQGEAHLQTADSFMLQGLSAVRLTQAKTQAIAEMLVQKHTEDSLVRGVTQSDYWFEGQLARQVEVRSARGKHVMFISPLSGKVLSSRYVPHSEAETFEIKARAYPIYEETEYTHDRLTPVDVTLRGLKATTPNATADPFLGLKQKRYLASKYHPVLAQTAVGQSYGFWSLDMLKTVAAGIAAALPTRDNTSAIMLDGQFATVSIHPSAVEMYRDRLGFVPQFSPYFRPDWRQISLNGRAEWEMVPTLGYLGRPLASAAEAMTREIRRHESHDPLVYIQDGFDEIQVYYAVTQLMETLQGNGFTDPDLSTRPFHAFLYDTDIAYRDNAYYTEDTINFTTYSATSQNMARDNPTIWHELGHGVMDRLMGSMLGLADTGGLSEGMADFVAALVIKAVTEARPYPGMQDARILNNTGFFLTNEVHDDGEAYGGAMHDLLEAAIARFGVVDGVRRITDLTMEAMRLTRNHPGLTAQEWFGHVLFADELGREGLRAPGEMQSMIVAALAGRNFLFDAARAPAQFVVKNGDEVVTDQGAGSRGAPILRELKAGQTAEFAMSAGVVDGDAYAFRFPVRVEVSFNGGPLQGNVHWVGEEKGPKVFELKDAAALAQFALTVGADCDGINREDGSCNDYVSVRVFDQAHELKPVAKKRFYVRVKKTAS